MSETENRYRSTNLDYEDWIFTIFQIYQNEKEFQNLDVPLEEPDDLILLNTCWENRLSPYDTAEKLFDNA